MKRYHVTLTESERSHLETITRKRKADSQIVKRAFALLAADQNQPHPRTDRQIQQTYHLSLRTIERLRQRFVEEGIEIALKRKKREVFKPKTFDGAVEAHLVALRCSQPPTGHVRWTIQLLTDQMVELNYVETIGRERVRTMLKKNELKPWRIKSWVIPEASAEFVCRMEDVLEVYQRAYDPRHPVVCLDEARRQLVSETRQGFTDKKGVQHVDYEYRREGVAEVFMVCEPLGGRRQVVITESHNSEEWARIVGRIVEEWYTDAERITLIQDNLSAHRKAALYEVFEPKRARAILSKLEFVYTPKHGSWLNVAEIELSVLTRQGLTHRVASQTEFEHQVQAWVKQRNDKSSKVDWHFTTEDARIKLKRLYPSIIDG